MKKNVKLMGYHCHIGSQVFDSDTFLRAADDDTGTNCWCRMVSTISSWWVFAKAFSSADDCASSCNAFCANGMANNTEIGSDGRKLRYAMFDAMW